MSVDKHFNCVQITIYLNETVETASTKFWFQTGTEVPENSAHKMHPPIRSLSNLDTTRVNRIGYNLTAIWCTFGVDWDSSDMRPQADTE